MSKGTVRAISISTERGQLKTEVPEADLIKDHGIENDGHAGDWNRQVTLLDWSSVQKANEEHHLGAGPGDFAENILIEGLDLSALSIGSRIKFGSGAVLELTQVGKEDHPSVVTEKFGISLLPYEGLFCKVIEGGFIKKGDPVEIILERSISEEGNNKDVQS